MSTVALLFATSCKIDQTKEAELPEVDLDIDAESGQLPSFDVDWADVNVGTRTKMVKVPKVVVVMEEVEVEVPYVDVDMPDEFGDKEERTIRVEAEVDGTEHEIEIKKVYASKNNIIVVSELEKKETTLGDKKLRISDQLTLNAPDLNVKHIIVGERPNRVFNSSYKYYSSMKDVEKMVEGYREIYSD
ncbi:hypothetical protein [Changchengzhania lutea]|uniref:hypothetical protein n=1 Tax=Changchengzhania lutea TaxID=2049305 RepID=UPI001FE49FE7|nr:hypothetical protein [Changchengzhania lutea]